MSLPARAWVFDDDHQHTDADDPRGPPDSGQPEATADEARRITEPPSLPFLWVRDFGDLLKPPPLRWLFRDTRTGLPFIRAGKCFALCGDGGVGKGFFALQMAVAIATGRKLFDTFSVEQQGRVALLVGEDDQAEIHHRLCRIANSFGISDLKPICDHIGVFPLSGRQVSFLERDEKRNPRRTAVFATLMDQLTRTAKQGRFTWTVVSVDPLSRFGGPDVETDQSAATEFVATLEHLVEQLPGQPSLQAGHHSSAESARSGKSNMRGVTGLRNAFRCVLTLDAFNAAGGLRGVLLRHDKTNLSPQAPPLWLVREANEPMAGGRFIEKAGVLRPATEEETAALATVAGSAGKTREERDQANQTRKREAYDADCATVLAVVPPHPGHITVTDIQTALRAAGTPKGDRTIKGILLWLEANGQVVDLSNGAQSKPRQWARTKAP